MNEDVEPMPKFIQVETTTSSREEAHAIARSLIESSLAARVQISGPIVSIYRWNDKTETSQEWRCTIKTRAEQFQQVQNEIVRLHSYDVPEILAVPLQFGSEKYFNWMANATAAATNK